MHRLFVSRFRIQRSQTSLLLACLLGVALSLTSTAAQSNAGIYRIEVLIFSQTPDAKTTEKPSGPYVLALPDKRIARLGRTPTWNSLNPQVIRNLYLVNKQLNRQATAISRSGDYKLLLHQAWNMHLGSAARSLDIILEGGDYYSNQPELIGTLNLSVARYLHLTTDLNLNFFTNQKFLNASDELVNASFAEKAADSTKTAQQEGLLDNLAQLPKDLADTLLPDKYVITSTARMQQKRRMRSAELHFLDSPYLGLLIRIDRVKVN